MDKGFFSSLLTPLRAVYHILTHTASAISCGCTASSAVAGKSRRNIPVAHAGRGRDELLFGIRDRERASFVLDGGSGAAIWVYGG